MDKSGKRFGKFGRVYVPNEERSGEWVLLESASFSNIDLRWYTDDNTIHPDYEKYTGKKFSFGFKIENNNRLGEVETFEGKLSSPLNLGENEQTDVEKLEEAFEMDMDWAQKFNIIPSGAEDSLVELVEKTQVGAMFVFSNPGRALTKHKLVHYLGVLSLMDDIVDSMGSSSSSVGSSYGLVPRQLEIIRQTFKGESMNLSPSDWGVLSPLLSELSGASRFEQARIMRGGLSLLYSYGKDTIKIGTDHQVKVVLQSVLRDLEADFLEKTKEWVESREASEDSDLCLAAKMKLGEATSGFEMMWEIVLVENGVVIDDTIRNSILFKELSHWFQRFGSKVNHLLSYQKEVTLEGGNHHNEVSYLHFLKKIPLNEALQKVLNEMNECVEMMLETRELLLQLHPENENLEAGVNTVINLTQGTLMMCGYSKRYHPDMVYDCYVE